MLKPVLIVTMLFKEQIKYASIKFGTHEIIGNATNRKSG